MFIYEIWFIQLRCCFLKRNSDKIPSMSIVVGVEGLLGSSKSTLIHDLQIEEPNRVFRISEYDSYANRGGIGGFPAFPQRNSQDAISSMDYFLGIESVRKQALRDCLTTLAGHVLQSCRTDIPQIVLLDRTFLSLLAFPYAAGVLSTVYDQYVYMASVEKVRDHAEMGEVIIPDAIIYLSLPDAAHSIDRVKQRGTFNVNSHFARPEFLEGLRDFYEKCRNSPSVYTIDALQSRVAVLREVQRIIANLDPIARVMNIERRIENLFGVIPWNIYSAGKR